MSKAIMPECFADTLLVETLVPVKGGYSHKHSCFKVEAAMTLGKQKGNFAVGIIDEDKKGIKYIGEFGLIAECAGHLILWQHPKHPHYIIQLCPAVEMWILNVCKMAGINLQDYSLPVDLDGLKKITKPASALKDLKLQKLFSDIKQRTEIEPVRKLIGWITMLKDQNYKVDPSDLKNA